MDEQGIARTMQASLGRRTFLKLTGGAAGAPLVAAALAGAGRPASAIAAPGSAAGMARATSQDADTTLIFAAGADADALDPRQTNTQEGYIACANIYDCLVLYDLGKTTLRPGLAEKWEVSENGLEYTFNLRQGVKFHDGADFNADAVVTWFNSIKEGAPGSQYDASRMPYMEPFFTGLIDTVEKVDDFTVKMILPRPYAPLLANLAIPIGGIPSPNAIEAGLDQLAVNPVGTGPFRVTDPSAWTRGSQLVVTANPDYWGGAPKLERVIFSVVPEGSTRLQQVEAGDIDIAWGLTPDDVRKAQDNPDLQIVEEAGLNTNSVQFNLSKDPFKSKEVRQALNYAINKEELSAGLYDGDMVPAGGVLPPVDWAFSEDLKGYPYDPDRAKELLAAAGYNDQNKLTFTLWAYTVPRGYNPAGDRLATAVQEYWRQVGVEAEIQTAEWTQYLANRRANQYDISLGGWMGDNGDPDNFLYSLLASENVGQSNTSWYANPQVDQLLVQAQEATDQEERKRLYQQAELIIVDEAPWVFLGYQKHQVVTSNTLQDFVIQPTYIYYLAGVSKA